MSSFLKFGIVSEAKAGYAKIFFADDNIVTDWWPIIHSTSLKDTESYILNVQEHVACFCSMYLEMGVVLGCIHNNQDLPDAGAAPGLFRRVFEDGTIIEYDKNQHLLTASVNGSIIIKATNEVRIVGDLSVTGEIKAEEVRLGSISLSTHKHSGVQSGGATSGPPL